MFNRREPEVSMNSVHKDDRRVTLRIGDHHNFVSPWLNSRFTYTAIPKEFEQHEYARELNTVVIHGSIAYDKGSKNEKDPTNRFEHGRHSDLSSNEKTG